MSLEDSIIAYINQMQPAQMPGQVGAGGSYYEAKRRTSRTGNVVVTIVEEGEVAWGGPVEDPFFSAYVDTYELVFSLDGALLSKRDV